MHPIILFFLKVWHDISFFLSHLSLLVSLASSYTILLLVLRASSWMWIPSSSKLFDSSKWCHVTVPMEVKEPALLLLLKCCNLCKKHSIMAWGSIILCRDISLALLRCPVCLSAYHPGQRASPSVLKTLNRLNPTNPSRLHQPKSLVQRNAPSQPKRATKMTSTTSHRSLRDTARKLPAHDRLICTQY